MKTMRTGEKLLLWPEGAPFAAECKGQEPPSLTAYPAEGKAGAVIVLPGGGYSHKAAHEGAPVAQMLQAWGVSGFVLDYRVAPCPHEAPMGDALRAIHAARAMGYEKVAILGFSAGGNVACCAAMHGGAGDPAAADPLERLPSKPDGLISCYSVVSFVENAHVGSRMTLLGKDGDSQQLARYYSAERHVTAEAPSAFLWHTADDDVVPVENSLSLAAAYSRCGAPFELHVFPHGRHGLGLAPEEPHVAQWTGLLKNWLAREGYMK